MMIIRIGIALLFLLVGIETNAQNLVLNGGFEIINTGVTPPPWGPYAVGYAPPWRSLVGTVDVSHPGAPVDLIQIPYLGNGCMRIGHGPNYEYVVGETMPLTAGQVYEVSYFVKKYQDIGSSNIRGVALEITPNMPAAVGFDYINDFNPQFQIEATSTTAYEQVIYCFLAETDGVHYIIIGGKGPPVPADVSNYYAHLVDEVSVVLKTDLSDMPTSQISGQTSFCIDDNIILDGSLSTNETSYQWRVCRINPVTGELQEIYIGGFINGQAGPFDINACYRVLLYTDNGCLARNSFDFCYINPQVLFIYNGDPVCEGDLLNLSVTGDNGWTYTWSQGGTLIGSGVGLNTMSVAPTQGNSTFIVTVLTPEGCTYSETLTLTVHSPINLAPQMDGIDTYGTYTAYVTAGDNLGFTSNPSNDNANEVIDYTLVNNIPSNFSYTLVQPSDGSLNPLTFFWSTSPYTPPGEYTFTLTLNDKNKCNPGISSFTYTIIIICDQCPVCVYYEDRGPSPQTPLPPETETGQCITAGWSQPVSTGTANVLFKAGQYIALGPSFNAGAGYQGIIDPSTCLTDCEDCCQNWTGFTYDPIQNFINFDDGDPATDIWQMTDINHPYCAFNAKGYNLDIINQYGNSIYNSNFTTTACCPFSSPAPENTITQSEISWNGYTTNIWGNQVPVSNGVYFYIVTLYGCNDESIQLNGNISVFGTAGIILNPDDSAELKKEQKERLELATAEIEVMNQLRQKVYLSPNPATETIQINGLENKENVNIHILDANGRILQVESNIANSRFNISKLASGTYYLRIYVNDSFITKKFVKK